MKRDINVWKIVHSSFRPSLGFFDLLLLTWRWLVRSVALISTTELSLHRRINWRIRYQHVIAGSISLKAPLECIYSDCNTHLAFECNFIGLIFVHFLAPYDVSIPGICVDDGRSHNNSTPLEADCDGICSSGQVHWEIDSISCLHTEFGVGFFRSANRNGLRVWIKVVRYKLFAF